MTIPTRLSNEAAARKHSGSYVDFYRTMLMKGDPLADDVVLAMEQVGHRAGMAMLDRALEKGIRSVPEAPPALVRLFEQLDEVPTWVDWERVNRGARAYQRTGIAGSLTLSAVSLMNGYHSSAAIKPLLFTGQLDKMARRRLAETGKFIAETIQVNGLRRFSTGFKSTVKVRLVHAFVRRMLSQSDRWDEEAWGVPINQADMAATNLSFSVALIFGTRQLGLRITDEEADAILHLWRYSGYLSGVDLGLLATNWEEGWYRAEVIDLMQPGHDEGSLLLANALRATTRERSENPLQDALTPYIMGVHDGLTWIVAGEEKATHLGTPNREWAARVERGARFVNSIEALRERLPFATRVMTFLGNQSWLGIVDQELKGVPATFEPPRAVPFAERFRAKVAQARAASA